ncbi:exopolygalacturonase-like [Magnolia sinica]|uniref:exopolygalacturonase-like n=1 Tax=Magnolia sinica TaxID=86752 RepID=UPI00265B2AAC|nr:exopolygalacturonase-like [Magnolia sinica]
MRMRPSWNGKKGKLLQVEKQREVRERLRVREVKMFLQNFINTHANALIPYIEKKKKKSKFKKSQSKNTFWLFREMGSKSNLQIACLVFLFAWGAEAVSPVKVFNVKDFGAIADGKTDSSKAFLDAWKEACAWNGMGRVLIPKGTFLVGPVLFEGPCKGPIIFQVSGVVKAPGLEKFPSDSWIVFHYINGLMVTGGGTFHGEGAEAWPHNQCSKNKKCKFLPTSLRFISVTNATIRSISSVDSKLFHMNIASCNNIKIQSIKISAPAESPNTDGIHIGDSSGVSIVRSVIGTGDDCISIGSGNSNIFISNVFCGPGHGISIGSLGKYPNEADVVGINVRNCTLTGTTNGIRIKTWQDSSILSAFNFTFQDIVMNNVANPIIIDQEYCPYISCNKEAPSRVKISDVKFMNIRGSSASQVAVNFLCSKGVPCQDVHLQSINLEYNGLDGPAKSLCYNIKGTSSGMQRPPSCL